MEREEQLKILYPALGTAVIVLLIGILIFLGDSSTPATNKAGDKSGSVDLSKLGDDTGMADSLPAPDAPEWKELELGIQYWDVKEGEGAPCVPGATVTIHYTGWTLDGSVFDSSRTRGAPTTFPLTNLIQGWQKGIPGMKPGGIRRLKIPPQYAYGERGSPPKIPGNATLIFEVKFLGSK